MSTDLKATLADAFDIGRREGSKEVLNELRAMIASDIKREPLLAYITARLKSIHDLSLNNPFKQKETKNEDSR